MTDSTSKAVPLDLQRAQEFLRNHGNSWLCDKADLFVAFAKEIVSAHAGEIERLSNRIKKLEEKLGHRRWEKVGSVREAENVARAEAAESKLSQLQLSNEEKAKKIAEQFDKWDEAGMWPEDSCEVEKRILAILDGGQQ